MVRTLLAIGLMALAAPACAAAPAARDPYAMMERADTDSDGRVSRAEATAARRDLFLRADRNGDRVLDDNDSSRRRRIREALEQVRAGADGNGDGVVTEAEFMAAPMAAFDRADADRDGYVTRTEIEAARGAMRSRSGR